MTVRAYTPQMRANFRNLYLDIFWFGVLAGSTIAFITIYATRLGATALEIGLLSAGPAVVNLLFSLPAGRWLERLAPVPATFWSAAGQRLGYLALALLPLVLGEQLQIWAVILITLVMSIPGTLLAISFNTLFAETVPPEWRAEVVGRRNALMAVSVTVTTLISGQLLDRLAFPINYVIVFSIGALGAALSTYYLSRLRLPARAPVNPPAQKASLVPGLDENLNGEEVNPAGVLPSSALVEEARSQPGVESNHPVPLPSTGEGVKTRTPRRFDLGQILYFDLLRTSFGPFMLAYLLFYTFQYLGIPLFPLVQVRSLSLTDGMISLGSSLFYAVMLIVSLRMVDISTRLGHKRTLATGATIFGIYPLLLGLAHGPALFWVASFMGGAAWAITNAGLTNRLMEKVPDDQRPAGMALHNLVLNLGILLGALAAPLLSDLTGLQSALFVVAGLRFLAGGIFWLWG